MSKEIVNGWHAWVDENLNAVVLQHSSPQVGIESRVSPDDADAIADNIKLAAKQARERMNK